ncbi:LPS O-antigen chain length determinant protein WzzB [Galenea microaerophila]
MEKQPSLQTTESYCATEDEIDLFELWQNLVSEWKTIALTTGIIISMALGYVLKATPSYQSTAYILPPEAEKVKPMNALHILFDNQPSMPQQKDTQSDRSQQASPYSLSYTPQQIFVFEQFLINLSSRELKKTLFEKYDLTTIYAPNIKNLPENKKAAALAGALEQFNKDFQIEKPKRKSDNAVFALKLTLKAQPNIVAKIVNEAIQRSRLITINQIYNDIMTDYTLLLNKVTNDINAIKKTAKNIRSDQIDRLNEAIAIAKKLNISSPKFIGQSHTVNIYIKKMPLYFYGYKFLEAEKQALESRTDDALFIAKLDDSLRAKLRENEIKLNQLQSLKIDKTTFDVVRIDSPAAPATQPIKPKKALILAVAGVTGLILGIFIALIRAAYKRRREEEASASAA